jgi:hypothetical protein
VQPEMWVLHSSRFFLRLDGGFDFGLEMEVL